MIAVLVYISASRRPKCGWDPGRRAALLPEAIPKDGYVTTRKKEKPTRHHSVLRARCAGSEKDAWKSRRQYFNPSCALLRGTIADTCAVVDILEKGGEDVVMRYFRSRVLPFSVSNKRAIWHRVSLTGGVKCCRRISFSATIDKINLSIHCSHINSRNVTSKLKLKEEGLANFTKLLPNCLYLKKYEY